MGNKKLDPIVRVLSFFEHEPLPAVKQALALVKRTVAARVEDEETPIVAKPKRRKRRTKAQMAQAMGTGAVQQPKSAVSLRPRSTSNTSAAAALQPAAQ